MVTQVALHETVRPHGQTTGFGQQGFGHALVDQRQHQNHQCAEKRQDPEPGMNNKNHEKEERRPGGIEKRQWGLAGQELPDIVDRLNEVDIAGPPGSLYGYQNVTFSMWDPIARRATGTPYPVLVDQMIFKPLGMMDASVGEIRDTSDLNMASPHVRGRGGFIALKPHQGFYHIYQFLN